MAWQGPCVKKIEDKCKQPKLPVSTRSAFAPDIAQSIRLQAHTWIGKYYPRISHDNYFHSVPGLMDVQASIYKPALDIYALRANS